MTDVIYPLTAAAVWLGFFYKLRDLMSAPHDASLRAMTCFLALLAGVYTLTSPEIWTAIDRNTGINNLSVLLSQTDVILLTGAADLMLIIWHPRYGHRRLAVRMVILGIAVLAMIALFVAAPAMPETPRTFVATFATNRDMVAYLSVYILTYSAAIVEIAVLSVRNARLGCGTWLRGGLYTLAISSLFGLLFSVLRVMDLMSGMLGLDPQDWEPLAEAATALAGTLSAVGITMPGWGPVVSLAISYIRLYPLWRELHDLYPTVVLERPSGLRPWRFALRHVRYRLARRVVEIADGRDVLRPYLDVSVTDHARESGLGAGLKAAELEAFVTAVEFSVACLRVHSGASPGTSCPEATPDHRPGSVDELQALLRMERIRRSPLTRRVTQYHADSHAEKQDTIDEGMGT